MQPNLAEDGRPTGPQIILGKAALRSTGPFDPGPELARYAGKVPDYVLGTDWARATTLQAQPAAVSPPARSPSLLAVRDESGPDARDEPRHAVRFDPREGEPPVVYTRYSDQDEPPPPPRARRWRYPSLGDQVRIRPPVERDYEADEDDGPDPGR
ncbi:MAG TPA: hypothetical protein VGC92_08720 [Phenylobacterium sp.]|jgi:hypothetical protein